MMRSVTLESPAWKIRADLDCPLDLSIPLRFDGKQPSAFGAPAATENVFRSGSFVGRVEAGGSCNCAEYRLVPHCNGTHTECVGHLTRQRVNVHEIARSSLEPALLVSIPTMSAELSGETTEPEPRPLDRLITARAIEEGWRRASWPGVQVRALALRTLPNESGKLSQRYVADNPPPYVSEQAARLLVDLGIEHLLVDVPSLDRLEDEGRLTAHRLFWGLPRGSTDVTQVARPQAIVTELMFAPDHVRDGRYLLALQLPPFAADAAPSRPILYPVIDTSS